MPVGAELGERLVGDLAAAPHRVRRAHDAGVADELRGAHALALGLSLEQAPEVLAEPDGGGAHRHLVAKRTRLRIRHRYG
jgi:hypothetical protein